MKYNKSYLVLLLIAFWSVSSAYSQNLEALFLQKDFEQVESVCADKIASQNMNSSDYFWLSLSLEQMNKPQRNLDILLEGTSLYPNDTSLVELLAIAYYEMGNFKEAATLLERFENKNSQTKLARIKEFYGLNNEAIDIYKSLLEADSTSLFLIKKIAKNYYRIDSFPQTIQYLEEATLQYEEDVESLYLLSKAYEKNEEFEKSLEIANRGIEIDSTQTIFLRQAGKASFQMKDYRKASDYFMLCYELNDTSLFVQKLFGISNHRIDANYAAGVLLKSAYEKDSLNFELCYFLGRTLKELRDYEESQYYLNKAYELMQPNPENLIAYHVEMVAIRKHFKQYQEMYREYQALYELSNDPVYVYYLGSTAQYYLKNKSLAFEHYKAFLSLTPEEEESDKASSDSGEMSLSIRKVAEENYELLKKELFFEGELDE